MALTLTIRGGHVYDGTGAPPVRADISVDGDRIAIVGDVPDDGTPTIDATGLAVCPGFVNVLSHAWASLQIDGAGPSELLQGVTTEVFGEAFSPGPTVPELVDQLRTTYGAYDVQFDFPRLSDGLDHIARRGITMNVASYLGGANLRVFAAGMENRPLTAAELDRLRGVVAEEMADGALRYRQRTDLRAGNYATTDDWSRCAKSSPGTTGCTSATCAPKATSSSSAWRS